MVKFLRINSFGFYWQQLMCTSIVAVELQMTKTSQKYTFPMAKWKMRLLFFFFEVHSQTFESQTYTYDSHVYQYATAITLI